MLEPWSLSLVTLLASLFAVLFPGRVAAGEAPTQESVEFLSDHPERIVEQRQSWGELGLDTCAHAPGQEPLPLRIGERRYTKGLGSHADGEIVVALDGAFRLFEAEVGVQWQQGRTGSVRFRIFVDDKLAYESGVVREADAATPVSVSVAGAEELRLVAADAGDGITCDCADWAEARLTRTSTPPASAARLAVNLAPFASVRSWDPEQVNGTAAGRLEEFPEADLRPFTELLPDAAGAWSVVPKEGVACIGLEWLERRRLEHVELELAPGAELREEARLEYWSEGSSGSTWQGRWVPLQGVVAQEGERRSVELAPRVNPELVAGTRKVRWLLPVASGPLRVRKIAAFGRSRWREIELLLAVDSAQAGRHASLTVYNGEFAGAPKLPLFWKVADPLRVTLRNCASTHSKADRTVLRVELTGGSGSTQAFGIGVDEVLALGAVWVKEAGLHVTSAANPVSPADWRERHVGGRTLLDQVGSRPDATLEEALARLHDPVQDLGPTLISLPADNRKFIVERNGTVRWDDRPEIVDCVDHEAPERWRCHAAVRFGGTGEGGGSGETGEAPTQRELADVSCLALELRGRSGSVNYTLRPLVAPLRNATGRRFDEMRQERVACELLLTAENPGTAPATASFHTGFGHPAGIESAIVRDPHDSLRATIRAGGRILAWIEAPATTRFEPLADGGRLSLPLEPGARATCRVVLPRWEAGPADAELVPDSAALVENARSAWRWFLDEQAQIDVPDPLLDRLIDASVVHCLAAARRSSASLIAPWIASLAYGPLESEAQAVVRGMQSMGLARLAGPALRYFTEKIDARGLLTTGYTVLGTGWHLWTLGEYCQLFESAEWLRAAAPDVVRACRFIMRERRKTMQRDAAGEKVPEYGLMPPGALADWNVYACYFYANANYCAGLRDAAAALAAIHDGSAAEIAADAIAYQDDILRAFHWAAARAPVVPLRDGTSVPCYPTQVYGLGPTENLYPAEDAGRSWCYDVELGAIHLIALGFLDPHSPTADGIVQHLEDVQFLRDGWFAYPAPQNAKEPFLFGGFAKVQPYYARTTETHALRDDVKAFVRSYVNAIPTLLNREDLSLWEHFHASGAWNKTHETGYFLQQTRTLLLTERGEDLWLAPFFPESWLADGKSVSVRDAPTRFGPVSYLLRSHLADGYVEATIEPPRRRAPASIVLRVRHPEGRPIRSVTIEDRPHTGFDPSASIVVLPPSRSPISLRVLFEP